LPLHRYPPSSPPPPLSLFYSSSSPFWTKATFVCMKKVYLSMLAGSLVVWKNLRVYNSPWIIEPRTLCIKR
jgi:hypothetical protein